MSYSRTEAARTLDEVQHELVREALREVEIDEPLEITTIGDVPAGTGMGSSSSLTVGLLAALYGYRHRVVSPRLLAEQACRIEMIAPSQRHQAIREALGRPRELLFKVARHGSRTIFIHY